VPGMRVVHIEDYFHPSAGYQVNVLAKYMAKQGHSVIVVTAEMEKIPEHLKNFFEIENLKKLDKEYLKETGVDILRLPLRGFISGRAIFKKNIFKIVDDLKPDILYVHGNDTLTAIRYILRLKKIKYPVVMDSHMLEMASVNRFSKMFRMFYRKFLAPILIENKIKVIRTQDDRFVEKCLGVPLLECPWISIGSDTLLFHPDENTKNIFRKDNNISENDFVVVYAGKFEEDKGGMFLAQTFERKFSTAKHITLLLVGNMNGEYGRKVDELFKNSENRIIRFPTQKYTDLARFYQAADLSVFPRQCALSFYDAQACGLPVISEDNSVNIDRLKNNNGFNFKAGDVSDFRSKILQCVEMPEPEFRQLGRNACKFVRDNYDYKEIAKKYTEILTQEYERFHGGKISGENNE